MANTFHGGSQSPNSLSKPIEKVFEDAQHTGEIILNSRKLREFPKLAGKYDLVDTIVADISRNSLHELPKEICAYLSMEKIQCYHNVIKSIPETIVQLQSLTYINLSRNQLTIIPSFISQLQTLEVLIASHNRLVSLPEEIGVLDKLMELDVSCNEISHLPIQIGDLKSLKSLNVRRNLLEILPVEISKLNLRKLDISGNRISKIPTVFRRIETLEEIILHDNPLTVPPAHVCTKGKQHIMKYLQIVAIREDKQRGILNEAEMKRFRKSLPPQQSVSSEEFRNLMESPDKWKRHTVLSSDSGYSTTDSIDKISWSPQETNSDSSQHLVHNTAHVMNTAPSGHITTDPRVTGLITDSRTLPDRDGKREPPPPPLRVNSRLSPDKFTPPPPLSPGKPGQIRGPPTPPTLYPHSPQTPLTPPTPQGPGPGLGSGPAQSPGPILGTSLEDEFTRELQRQKAEYENKKKLAEQIRIQQEEEDEREQRRRAAQRIQDEQRAMLERQREETRLLEEKRIWEEARQREAEEAKRQEELRHVEEARRAEEMKKAEEARRQEEERAQSEAKQQRVENKKPALSASNSFKEERRPGSGTQYRRTTSDSNQRLPAHVQQTGSQSSAVITNGPIPEQTNGNVSGSTTPTTPTTASPNNTFTSQQTTGPRSNPVSNGPSGDRPSNLQGTVSRRTKVADKAPVTMSRVAKPTEKHGRSSTTTSTRTGVPMARKSNMNQDEELRKSTQSLKSADGTNKPGEQRLRTIQKEAVNNYMNRRSSGSTSSEDDRKRSTPTRTGLPTSTTTSKRAGTGMSSTRTPTAASRLNTTSTPTSRSNTTTRIGATTGPPGASTQPRRARKNSTSSTTSVSSTASKSSVVDKSKRGGAVMTNAQVKMLDEYNKEANPNYTLRRQNENYREHSDQMETLRKTISTRLKRTLPDSLSEALSDGVLLCHLANQIRPRSVASVHVPSPAVPKLTSAKCRRNVENFLEACRKIGVSKDQICGASDILEEKGLNRVAMTVAALVAIATHPNHAPATNV